MLNKMKTTVMLSTAMFVGLGSFAAVSAQEVTQARDTDTFEAVSLNGSMDVNVTVGGDFKVEVVADADVQEYIKTEVRNGVLHIRPERGSRREMRRSRSQVLINVTMPSIRGFRINGSGDALVRNINGGDFEVDLNGSGDMELVGSCDHVVLDVNGSGDIEARDLACTSGMIEINGSGDVSVTINGNVEVDTRGSGDIDLYGDSRLTRFQSRGSSDISLHGN